RCVGGPGNVRARVAHQTWPINRSATRRACPSCRDDVTTTSVVVDSLAGCQRSGWGSGAGWQPISVPDFRPPGGLEKEGWVEGARQTGTPVSTVFLPKMWRG